MEGTLIIFDFDCTLVEVDSDPWVAEQLDAALLMEDLRSRLPWTAMMDSLMEALHAKGIGLSDVEEALRRIPLQPEKISAIKAAHALGCELRIVSDANSFFIKTILDKYGVTSLFTAIHTNPAHADEDGRLHIAPFHPKCEAPHGCPLCPPNMCKGKIIDGIRAQMAQSPKRIIYIGDGCGDYCPSLRLQICDCILPREGYPLLELLAQNMSSVKASIYPWSSAQIMEEKLVALIKPQNLLDDKYDLLDGVACTKCALPLGEQANEAVSIKTIVFA